MKSKKTVAFLLAFVMTICLLPSAAFAASDYSVEASGSSAYQGDKLTYTFTTPTSITSIHAFINGVEMGKTTKYTTKSGKRVWTIDVSCTRLGTFDVQFVAAKNGKGVKLLPEKAYSVTVKAVPNTYKVLAEKSSISVGETVACNIVTPKTVTKVNFTCDGSVIDSSSSGTVNSDGTKSWKLNLSFSSSGNKKVVFNAYTDTKLSKTATYTIPVSANETAKTMSDSAKESITALVTTAYSKLGAAYVLGGKGPNTFDCSGFVYWCLNSIGYEISYMTSAGWGSTSRFTKVYSMDEMIIGDIACFDGHVGIWLGSDSMIDASSSEGKIRIYKNVSKNSYWTTRFKHGCRVFE